MFRFDKSINIELKDIPTYMLVKLYRKMQLNVTY